MNKLNTILQRFGATKTVMQIFWVNVIVFIAGLLLQASGFPFYETFSLFSPSSGKFQIYQLVTHMFLHGGFLHILFNMMVLVSFGGIVENYFGRNKFLLFYLISGLGAAFLQILLVGGNVGMVGASGAIFGVMMVATIRRPNDSVYLFLIPYPIKMKIMIPILFGIELFSGIISMHDSVAHFAHVGGAIAGVSFYFIDRLMSGKKYYR